MNRNLNFVENNNAVNLQNKINQLSSEISNSKTGERWTPLAKKRVESILNELRYEANKIKYLRFVR
jgi:hypothetical protein